MKFSKLRICYSKDQILKLKLTIWNCPVSPQKYYSYENSKKITRRIQLSEMLKQIFYYSWELISLSVTVITVTMVTIVVPCLFWKYIYWKETGFLFTSLRFHCAFGVIMAGYSLFFVSEGSSKPHVKTHLIYLTPCVQNTD